MVQASHLKSWLGSEGCPIPATLAAAILNSYDEPSVKPSTYLEFVHINPQNKGCIPIQQEECLWAPWGWHRGLTLLGKHPYPLQAAATT